MPADISNEGNKTSKVSAIATQAHVNKSNQVVAALPRRYRHAPTSAHNNASPS